MKGVPASMTSVVEKNKAAGQHFFSEGAMRFFNSQLESGLLKGNYFITSERMELSMPKRYTVRQAVNGGERIHSVSEHCQYGTLDNAKEAISELQQAAGIYKKRPAS